MIQIVVLANHANGKDTHIRNIKIYAPKECVSAFLILVMMISSMMQGQTTKKRPVGGRLAAVHAPALYNASDAAVTTQEKRLSQL